LDIDLDDDVMKWLWYAIFAAAASIIFWLLAVLVVGPLIWISGLASLVSSVCFVIWLLKYLEIA